jgi:hypothetical protein
VARWKAARGFVTIRQGAKAWRAEVTGVDEAHDLARLTVILRKNESFTLPLVPLRKVRTLRVGERVYAIGAPRGLEQTLSEGLVSGLPASDEETIIQTSAAISSGSSGGGLFDSRGQLIGVTTLYLRESQNLNFAVPADHVQALQRTPYVLPRAADDTIVWDEPEPPAVRPAAAQEAGRQEVPLALGQVRAIVIAASSRGPIAEQGGLTEAWLRDRPTQRLRRAGFRVFRDGNQARDAEMYAVLVIADLGSLKSSAGEVYPWSFRLEVSDTTAFTDGSQDFVTIWGDGTFGFGGSKGVLDQVVETIDQVADKLALAILATRPD